MTESNVPSPNCSLSSCLNYTPPRPEYGPQNVSKDYQHTTNQSPSFSSRNHGSSDLDVSLRSGNLSRGRSNQVEDEAENEKRDLLTFRRVHIARAKTLLTAPKFHLGSAELEFLRLSGFQSVTDMAVALSRSDNINGVYGPCSFTLIELALYSCTYPILEWLLEAGADVNASLRRGSTNILAQALDSIASPFQPPPKDWCRILELLLQNVSTQVIRFISTTTGSFQKRSIYANATGFI